MKVAIVGSGVSGLVAAYRLAGRGHRVTLFEAEDRLGGHAHTVEVDVMGRRHAVDVGFIVFNPMTYPRFSALLEELEIDSQPADMGFSVSSEADGLEYGSHTLRSLFAQPGNAIRPSFWRMVHGIRRFNREAERILESSDAKLALGSYLQAAGYDAAFLRNYILPLGSSIWSSTPERILEFPAREFVAFFANHGLLQARPEKHWRTLPGGSRRYVEAIARGYEVRSGTPVEVVRPGVQGVDVEFGRRSERFDRAVLASHAPEALRLLGDANGVERAILGAIPYQRNDAALHSDDSLLPTRRAARKSWNYRIPEDPGAPLSITYDMNRLQSLDATEPMLVTLNPPPTLNETSVHRRLRFDHPVFTERGFAAQQQHRLIDGARGVHFCGAYWGYGFHEDGVRSALRVVERIGGNQDA